MAIVFVSKILVYSWISSSTMKRMTYDRFFSIHNEMVCGRISVFKLTTNDESLFS